MQDLGRFIFSDTGTDVEISIIDQDGAALDLTGATDISLECRSPQRDVFSVTGDLQSPNTDGRVIFEDIGSAFEPTSARPVIYFEGEIKWTQDGELHYSRDSVRFSIELFP